MEAQSTIEVRVRSTPTPFHGRHTRFGFVPDSEFKTMTLTPEQYAEIKENKDLFTEIGAAPANQEAVEAAIRKAAELLTAERRAHSETKAQLETALANHGAEVVSHGKTRGELEAIRQLMAKTGKSK